MAARPLRCLLAFVVVPCLLAIRPPMRTLPKTTLSDTVGRRAVSMGAVLSTVGLFAQPAYASRSRTDGYAIQRSETEWVDQLSSQQYYILREGGTEPPNSSPLYREKRSGTFKCAGCQSNLFESDAKFNSGTGWPSFATALDAVEVTNDNPLVLVLAGAEVRCKTCGGHLGDLFGDGFLFPGTAAFLSGKRYCIDGAALVFQPADGSSPILGESGSNDFA
mmetsp:Transcript_13179/g.33776  ORF Transcript_13179/g.33776 Transcript_13179/m.33776 type:complete len:220 (-) Transcript_13179:590-1249(-)|eukprot:CAMPEP_0115859744 /NCGR_PEP_ID=MMETSP0287-20121206/16774_1 /TAXON_ID=412157 /ORGANISM="Chrysochromulina rotalis, Strain UIO044" /LENGTH=219 /DNA_ID=CAMNT_0003314055 /DNA_START=38 /DNA_END=697 /DNA_ORIENTATION=+